MRRIGWMEGTLLAGVMVGIAYVVAELVTPAEPEKAGAAAGAGRGRRPAPVLLPAPAPQAVPQSPALAPPAPSPEVPSSAEMPAVPSPEALSSAETPAVPSPEAPSPAATPAVPSLEAPSPAATPAVASPEVPSPAQAHATPSAPAVAGGLTEATTPGLSTLAQHQRSAWAWAAADSHVGRVRRHNEDRFFAGLVEGSGGLIAVVADGMGGHQAGEKAAELAVETFAELALASQDAVPTGCADRYEALLGSVQRADAVIKERGAADLDLTGMGTTVVAAWFDATTCTYVYAGDSRLYQLRDHKVCYRSKDHSIVQVLMEVGQLTEDEARKHPMRSQLTSCLGGGKKSSRLTVDPPWISSAVADALPPAVLAARPGDVFVLCSDGLCGEVPDATLESLVARYGPAPEQLVAELIEAALAAGGRDNITVVAVRYLGG
jgi:PPM family protein phosphatase